MRRALLAVVLALAGPIPSAGQTAGDRFERVEQWLKAVVDHEPGTADRAATNVGSWSARDVRLLWIDANVIAQLMRDPRKSGFSVKAEGQQAAQSIVYSAVQLRRMKALACAAAGIPAHPVCVEVRAANALDDPDLSRLSTLAAASRLAGDDNFVLRRGALLQADVAMLLPQSTEPIGPTALPGPQRIRVLTTDGMAMQLAQLPPHWELARMLLGHVRPAGAPNPAPGRDDMVRLWYRATAAWMQRHEQHDTDHLDRARAVFPNDPDLLFLSACQHETYAGSLVQSALRSVPTATGTRSDVASERSELHQAESFFRRALAANPAMWEARLRYGRVLLLLERHGDAATELRRALGSSDDNQQRYYGELFLGAAETALRNFPAARDAYGRAAALFPNAQSPRIALSELARRLGDRGGALREMQVIFDLPAVDRDRDDPWWHYFVVQGRNADELLEAMQRPFRHES